MATDVSYDTQGTAFARVTLAAAPGPGDPVKVGVAFGQQFGAACTRRMGVAYTVPTGPAEALLNPPQQFLAPPTVHLEGPVVTITSTDARNANQPWDCAQAGTGPSEAQLFDVTAVIPIKAPAPPPPPAPSPAPPPAAQPPAGKPPASTRAARLRRAIRACNRRHRGSKRSTKRARKRCVARARKRFRKS